MTKDELIDALEDSREAFLDVLETIPPEYWEKEGATGNWSVKDVLHHLTMWEAELVRLLWLISQAQVSSGPPPNNALFSDMPFDERNALWQAQGQTRTLDQVLEDFRGVRRQTTRRLLSIPEKTLQNPDQFAWMKGAPLSKLVFEVSIKHEGEHAQTLRDWDYRQQAG